MPSATRSSTTRSTPLALLKNHLVDVFRRAMIVAEELLVPAAWSVIARLLWRRRDSTTSSAFWSASGWLHRDLCRYSGVHDERVSSALRYCSPSAILTTSSAVDAIVPYARPDVGQPAPHVVEVDSLDLDSPRNRSDALFAPEGGDLQYLPVPPASRPASSSLQERDQEFPTGGGGLLPGFRRRTTGAGTTIVSWLPFYHDMGLMLGIGLPLVIRVVRRDRARCRSCTRPDGCNCSPSIGGIFAAANFAFELAVPRTSDDDMTGRDLGDVQAILNGSERIHARNDCALQ